MSPELKSLSDHDLLIQLHGKVENMNTIIEELARGQTANCATERARVAEAEKQIEKLWNSKASKTQFAVITTLVSGIYAVLLGLLITKVFGG